MRAPQEDIGALLVRAKVLRSLVDVEEELPRVLRYEILQVLGVGGMGSVFLAFDPRLERKVALKVVRMEKGAQSARVLREAKALALLSHPNVVSVFDAEPTSDGLCISMEYLVGPTLRTWMKEEERPWQQTVEKLIEAGRGLQAAHEAKLVHGDFKPENVVFDSSEKAVVVDLSLIHI